MPNVPLMFNTLRQSWHSIELSWAAGDSTRHWRPLRAFDKRVACTSMKAVGSIKYAIYSAYKDAFERVTPAPVVSKFEEKRVGRKPLRAVHAGTGKRASYRGVLYFYHLASRDPSSKESTLL